MPTLNVYSPLGSEAIERRIVIPHKSMMIIHARTFDEADLAATFTVMSTDGTAFGCVGLEVLGTTGTASPDIRNRQYCGCCLPPFAPDYLKFSPDDLDLFGFIRRSHRHLVLSFRN